MGLVSVCKFLVTDFQALINFSKAGSFEKLLGVDKPFKLLCDFFLL